MSHGISARMIVYVFLSRTKSRRAHNLHAVVNLGGQWLYMI